MDILSECCSLGWHFFPSTLWRCYSFVFWLVLNYQLSVIVVPLKVCLFFFFFFSSPGFFEDLCFFVSSYLIIIYLDVISFGFILLLGPWAYCIRRLIPFISFRKFWPIYLVRHCFCLMISLLPAGISVIHIFKLLAESYIPTGLWFLIHSLFFF